MMSALVIGLAAQVTSSAVQLGVADVQRDGRVCVALPGAPPAVGTPVTLVQIMSPQSAMVAMIARPIDTCETLARADLAGPYYLVTSPPTAPIHAGLRLAVRGRPAARVQRGVVMLDLGQGSRRAQAHSCTSTEGIHLTLWAGVPLKSKRLWHEYFYLGYDVEPSCQGRDGAPE